MSLTKQDIMQMAVDELEDLLNIIGDLGYLGYKIARCKICGNSYQQCANKLKIPKSTVQYHWEKCTEKQYDIALKKLLGLE